MLTSRLLPRSKREYRSRFLSTRPPTCTCAIQPWLRLNSPTIPAFQPNADIFVVTLVPQKAPTVRRDDCADPSSAIRQANHNKIDVLIERSSEFTQLRRNR